MSVASGNQVIHSTKSLGKWGNPEVYGLNGIEVHNHMAFQLQSLSTYHQPFWATFPNVFFSKNCGYKNDKEKHRVDC